MIIDSSVLIDIDQGKNKERLDRLNESSYAISAVTLMELSTGRYLNDLPDSDFQKIFDNLEIIPVDKEVADKAGKIMAKLMDKGQRIEINDIYIAATSIIHDQTILTANTKHFERLEKAKTVDWENI